jgi:hypothetical protein
MKSTQTTQKPAFYKTPYRIAIRAEGKFVNAYWTRSNTMQGAELIASIHRDIGDANSEAFQGFRMLMEVVAVILGERATGQKVESVEIHDAPEHERGGNA